MVLPFSSCHSIPDLPFARTRRRAILRKAAPSKPPLPPSPVPCAADSARTARSFQFHRYQRPALTARIPHRFHPRAAARAYRLIANIEADVKAINGWFMTRHSVYSFASVEKTALRQRNVQDLVFVEPLLTSVHISPTRRTGSRRRDVVRASAPTLSFCFAACACTWVRCTSEEIENTRTIGQHSACEANCNIFDVILMNTQILDDSHLTSALILFAIL